MVNREGRTRDVEEVEERARRALEGTTVSVSGRILPVRAESFCVYSDVPNAPTVASRIREVLRQAAR